MENDADMPPLMDTDEEELQLDVIQNVAVEGTVLADNNRHQNWKDRVRSWKVVVLLSYLGPLCAAYSCITFPLSFEVMRGLHGYMFYITETVLAIDLMCHIFRIYPNSNHIISNHRWCTIIIPRCSLLRMFLEVVAIIQLQRILQSYKVGRYLICIKVVRVFKVRDLFSKLEQDLPMKYNYINSSKLIILQCYLAHISSCAFYHVAVTFPPPSKDTWLKHLQLGDTGIYQNYIASFYFAIVTMYTVGYGDIHPVNAVEMMFTIGVIMLGSIGSVYIIGHISELFERGVITFELMVKMLKDYVEKNGLVDKRLANQTMLTIRHGEDLTNKEVAEDYPRNIRVMLYRPFIEMVGLFQRCPLQLIDHIASEVIEEFRLQGEVIIEGGTIVDHLYIFCDGLLERMRSGFGTVAEEQIQDVCCIGVDSLFYNVAQCSTIQVVEPSRLLRIKKTALMKILGTNFSGLTTIQENLQQGTNFGYMSDLSLSIVEHKAEQATWLNLAIHAKKTDKLHKLLEKFDVSIGDDYKRSPLHIAAEVGDTEIASLLIDRRSEINLKDFHGNTPLLEAINNEHYEVAHLLWKEGAFVENDEAAKILYGAFLKHKWDAIERMAGTKLNPNAANYNDQTLLHKAAERGSVRVVEILIKAGANITPMDMWGRRPVDGARKFGREEIIKKLTVASRAGLRFTLMNE